MRYAVWDLETTIRVLKDRKSSPFHPMNKIIVSASCIQDSDINLQYDVNGIDHVDIFDYLDSIDVLVLQNAKFDLLYCWKDSRLRAWIKNGGKIWDTMQAEYLLTAQVSTFASLNKMSEKYGGSAKNDIVKAYWDAGIDTPEIDPDILLPYAKDDINNTRIVFLEQFKEATRLGMVNLLEGYMDHILALTEMEYNGLKVDIKRGHQLVQEYTDRIASLKPKFTEIPLIRSLNVDFNPDKNDHVSSVLFNTPLKVTTIEQVLDEEGNPKVYSDKALKAGKPVLRKRVDLVTPKGFGIDKELSKKHKTRNVYSSDIKVLKTIRLKYATNIKLNQFLDLLIDYREATKVLTTYLYSSRIVVSEKFDAGVGRKVKVEKEIEKGVLSFVHFDRTIHHQLHSAKTITGRLSSSKPNLQNVPKVMRQLFVSHYPQGVLAEFDYSQLEVVVQAYLSQSDKMIRDLKNGVDFHCKRVGYAEGLTYDEVLHNLQQFPEVWSDKRRRAKTVSYQKAYGALPKSIAEAADLPIEFVKKIFAEEDKEYPEVSVFVEGITRSIQRTRTWTPRKLRLRDKDNDGRLITDTNEKEYVGYYQSITGKRYHWNDYGVTSAKLRAFGDGIFRYFSGPEIANYTVQGTAADIVSFMVAKVFRLMFDVEGVKLINEVHDSLLVDFQSVEIMNKYAPVIKATLESVAEEFQEKLGIVFNVPIKVDMKYGERWGENDE